MSIPVSKTWVDGEDVPENDLNDYVRDPINWFLSSKPIYVGRNTVQTTMTSDHLLCPLNVDDRKVGFTHTLGDTKVYATEPGWYSYTLLAGLDSTTTGTQDSRGVWLYKNGTDSGGPGAPYTGAMDIAAREIALGGRTGMVYLNGSTDYVEMFLYQSTGSTSDVKTMVTFGLFSALSLEWIGRDA